MSHVQTRFGGSYTNSVSLENDELVYDVPIYICTSISKFLPLATTLKIMTSVPLYPNSYSRYYSRIINSIL